METMREAVHESSEGALWFRSLIQTEKTKTDHHTVCEKVVIDNANNNEGTNTTGDAAEVPTFADIDADDLIDVKYEPTTFTVVRSGDQEGSVFEAGNSYTVIQLEAFTAETTPEKLPTAAKIDVALLESEYVELGSSTLDSGKGTSKMSGVKPLKNREKRFAKKAAKAAALPALRDQSKMFKLSKLKRT